MDAKLNFVVKLTTSCPANCKCCTNRQREFINKNEKIEYLTCQYLRKYV